MGSEDVHSREEEGGTVLERGGRLLVLLDADTPGGVREILGADPDAGQS